MNGAEAMELDQAKITLAAGTENMSAAPFTLDGNSVRWGVALGKVGRWVGIHVCMYVCTYVQSLCFLCIKPPCPCVLPSFIHTLTYLPTYLPTNRAQR